MSVTKTYKCDLCEDVARHPMDLRGFRWAHRPDLGRSGIVFAANPYEAETHLCGRCWEDLRSLSDELPF